MFSGYNLLLRGGEDHFGCRLHPKDGMEGRKTAQSWLVLGNALRFLFKIPHPFLLSNSLFSTSKFRQIHIVSIEVYGGWQSFPSWDTKLFYKKFSAFTKKAVL